MKRNRESEQSAEVSSAVRSGVASLIERRVNKRVDGGSPSKLRFTLIQKIALPFAILLVLMIAMASGFVLWQMTAEEDIQVLQLEAVKQAAAGNLRFGVASLLMSVNDYIITGDNRYRHQYQTATRLVEKYLRQLRELPLRGAEEERIPRIAAGLDSIYGIAARIFAYSRARLNPESARLMETMDHEYGERVYAEISEIFNAVAQRAEQTSRDLTSHRNRSLLLLLLSLFFACGVSAVVVFLTFRRISVPLRRLTRMAERIAVRDFSTDFHVESHDEVGALVRAFNTMAGEIHRRYEELEQFAYVVAHDLKSPLVSVRGMAEILQTDFGQNLDDSAKEFLRMIVEASTRMSHLIDDLLGFARAGKVEFSATPVPMRLLVEEAQKDLNFVLHERKAVLEIQDDLPAVICDPLRMKQVWSNLLSNALKYNDTPAPRIEVGVLRSDSNKQFVTFFMRDNGIGISPDQVDRIFMPFQRGVTDAKYDGTGIGLAIVKRIVQNHNGNVWVESPNGKGSTFYFTLPAAIVRHEDASAKVALSRSVNEPTERIQSENNRATVHTDI
jgi:signal transduction histidine kinase